MMQFERWSLVLIQEALLRGTRRREDFQDVLGLAPDLLDMRLGALVRAGILTESTGDDDDEPGFDLTPMGRDLETSLLALDAWSRRWDPLADADLPPLEAASAVAEATDQVDSTAADSEAAARAGGEHDEPVEPDPPIPGDVELTLLENFSLTVGNSTVAQLSLGSQRLLALLALRDRATARIALAGTMWPAASDERAGISLRSAISRLEPSARAAIATTSTGLGLAANVAVDFRDAQALAHRILNTRDPIRESDLDTSTIAALSRELLPDWYDDWIVAEADDWRHLRMNALEALSQRLVDAGHFGDAAAAARAAMRIDPLRESPHATLVRVHLATGNQSQALEVYERYRTMLQAALDIEPTSHLSALVQSIQR